MNHKILSVFLIAISFLMATSCQKLFTGKSKFTKVIGIVTDIENGKPIKNVKLTVYTEDFDMVANNDIETEYSDITDDKGEYEIKFDRIEGQYYYIKPSHELYIYPILNNWYPILENGVENEINFNLTKKGKIKLKGFVDCFYNNGYNWLDSVKITLLNREIGSTSYPEESDLFCYSDKSGMFYLEYDENINLEFFLKPEKEGFYYEYEDNDFLPIINYDPGYIVEVGIRMKILQ